MYYCGKECQRNDWKHHKYECKIFKNYPDFRAGLECFGLEINRLILRLYLYVKHNPECVYESRQFFDDDDSKRCFNDLMTHRNEFEKDSSFMSSFLLMGTIFKTFLKELDSDLLFECLCKTLINECQISSIELLGRGLYIAESQLDHSCLPNSVFLSEGNQMAIEAIRPIKSGEKITVTYIDLFDSKNVRQERLAKRYYFTCNCERCESIDPMDFDEFRQLYKKFEGLLYEKNWIESYKIGLELFPLMKDVYHDYHPELISFTSLMFMKCVIFYGRIYSIKFNAYI
ncbi:SET and MYND domain-containing protein [Euroglyphus maynei]|uniref:SET and MYND domain-containing protein n=1 Tax=Euroglyphus maynei TaxID=6958 RepID=A0A1Y3BAW1_EURMA|nr:SET and MYND domain-containing protein [Euroglyphus maynei]